MALFKSVIFYRSFYLFISWHLFKVSWPDVVFISITSYAMTLYRSVIVVIFYIGAYIK